MFYKILSVINIAALAIIGYLVYTLSLNVDNLSTEVTELSEKIISAEHDKNDDSGPEEEEEDPVENTLLLSNGGGSLDGFADLRGYMVTESKISFGEQREIAYLTFNESTDDTIKEFIDKGIAQGNTINRKSGDAYYLALGCNTGNRIEGPVFDIEGELYSSLKSSSSENPITVRAFFGKVPPTGGPCVSFLTGLQKL